MAQSIRDTENKAWGREQDIVRDITKGTFPQPRQGADFYSSYIFNFRNEAGSTLENTYWQVSQYAVLETR